MFRPRLALLALLFLLLGVFIEARPPGLPVQVVEIVVPVEVPATPTATVDKQTTKPPQCPEALKIIFFLLVVLFFVGAMFVAVFSRFFNHHRGTAIQMTNLPPQYSYSY
ncbi:unnamed protein product [Caenorhabditis brenneri]